MRLSDSIALGRVLKMHVPRVSRTPEQGCVLQIGLAANGIMQSCEPASEILRRYPWTRKNTKCPICTDVAWLDDVAWILVHLNDEHKWNLDQMIDWVRSIEPAELAESVSDINVEEAVPEPVMVRP
jgi:hypothetical protein